jgi:hypothetical protein
MLTVVFDVEVASQCAQSQLLNCATMLSETKNFAHSAAYVTKLAQ